VTADEHVQYVFDGPEYRERTDFNTGDSTGMNCTPMCQNGIHYFQRAMPGDYCECGETVWCDDGSEWKWTVPAEWPVTPEETPEQLALRCKALEQQVADLQARLRSVENQLEY